MGKSAGRRLLQLASTSRFDRTGFDQTAPPGNCGDPFRSLSLICSGMAPPDDLRDDIGYRRAAALPAVLLYAS
jgi:hypothetical protein